jgi:hypothetical protein
MGTGGPFPGAKERPRRDADHSPHLVPRSCMSRSYTPLPPSAFVACNGTALAFSYWLSYPSVAFSGVNNSNYWHNARWTPLTPGAMFHLTYCEKISDIHGILSCGHGRPGGGEATIKQHPGACCWRHDSLRHRHIQSWHRKQVVTT